MTFGVCDYPERYRKSIRTLMTRLGTDAETAYNMMVMTATLMDLHTDDDEVVDLILEDCKTEVGA